MPALKNLKHENFCLAYMVDMNGTRAAIEAGYSPKTATSQASDLMDRPDISERVAELQQEKRDRFIITADKVINELACIALANPSDYLDKDGEPIPIHLLPSQVAASISKIHIRTTEGGTTTTCTPHDKVAALVTLGKHFKLWNDKLELLVPEPIKVNVVLEGQG